MKEKREEGIYRTLHVLLVSGMFFFASGGVGCALNGEQVSAVRNFSLSTAAVADIAASELVGMRNSTIAMNEQRLELDPASGPNHTDLDESFDVDDVEVRVHAASVLSAYGELLLSLATDSETEEIKIASDRFVSSVGALASDDKKLSDEKAQALGTVVTTVGGWVVECKRTKAIRRIVAESSEQVKHLSDLLAADLDPGAAHLATGFKATIDELRLTASDVLTAEPAPSLQERSRAVTAYRLATENDERLTAVAERASVAIQSLSAANAELDVALHSKKSTLNAIKALAQQARTLHQAVRVLGSNDDGEA